jgi:hypothetical protein
MGEFHSLSEVAKTSILKKGLPTLNHSSRNWLPRSQFSARLSGLSRSDLAVLIHQVFVERLASVA